MKLYKYSWFISFIINKIFELSINHEFKLFKLNLFNPNNILENKIYENAIPYINPKNLSKIIPNICLSKSELKNFLIFFKTNNEMTKIIGIDIIIPEILLINSKFWKDF